MSNPPFVVNGPTGGAPNRLEIHDFVKNEKFFSLYIQALRAFLWLNFHQVILNTYYSRGYAKGKSKWNPVIFSDRRHSRSALRSLEWC